MKEKILIFDGISHLPLGRQIYDAVKALHSNTVYVDPKTLRKKKFLSVRRSLAKKAHIPRLGRPAKRFIQSMQPTHLIVIANYNHFLEPTWVTQLKRKQGFKLVLIDADTAYAFYHLREKKEASFITQELKTYDLICTYSKVMCDFFRRMNAPRTEFLPYGGALTPHKTTNKKTVEITFVGRAEPRRIAFLEKIADQDLQVFGSDWSRHEAIMSEHLRTRLHSHVLWHEQLIEQLQRSKIVLNICTCQWAGLETGVNLRVFEALAAGCFLLTDYCEELHDLFEVGQEIETFCSSNELRDKVTYYLKHDAERIAIAKRGHEKFKRLYTWEIRAKALLQLLRTLA